MPRRGGGGFGGRSSSRSRSQSQSPPRPAPKPAVTQPHAPTQQRGGFLSGMGGMLMTGMALGAGSEIAHQGVRGLMGSGSSHGKEGQENENIDQSSQNTQEKQGSCNNETQSFIECFKKNNDISFCQMYSDALKECQKKYGN